jgi:hypothetical protein
MRLLGQLVSGMDAANIDNRRLKKLSLDLQAINSSLDVVKDSLQLRV